MVGVGGGAAMDNPFLQKMFLEHLLFAEHLSNGINRSYDQIWLFLVMGLGTKHLVTLKMGW